MPCSTVGFIYRHKLIGGELSLKDEAILALEDGTIFYGRSIGIKGVITGEVVFNTSISGYQELSLIHI